MNTQRFALFSAALLMTSVESTAQAQTNGGDIYWHIDGNVKSCSMVIDPSLTQAQWKRFVTQVGAISSFKTLASAEPLGALHFTVGVDNAYTPVDQRDLAWINTFAHPDEECPLGDVITYPTIRARIGVSDQMDLGVYWTTAPDANYGMIGAEMKYALMSEAEIRPASAVRASCTILTGVSDFSLNIYSVEVLTSKRIAKLTPYVGFRGTLAVGTEKTSKVALKDEVVPVAQGYAGVVYSIWLLTLSAEYNIASVNTFAFAVALRF